LAPSRQFLITGDIQGAVRFFPVPENIFQFDADYKGHENSIQPLYKTQNYHQWKPILVPSMVSQAHQPCPLGVRNIVTSPDHSFFATVGGEGAVFVWQSGFENGNPDLANTPAPEPISNQPDITEANAYSLQEAKIKAGKDKEKANAENIKIQIVSSMEQLRAEYRKLISQWQSYPSYTYDQRVLLDVNQFPKVQHGIFQNLYLYFELFRKTVRSRKAKD
jgi:hypothetical protein